MTEQARSAGDGKKVTVPHAALMKERGEPISMVTAYDYVFAGLVDQAGVDVILVGDSLGMVVQGHETTLGVTLGDVVYHARMVVAARRRALVVADLPFGSYQGGPEQALASSVRLLKEAGAEAVKLEGGLHVAPSIETLTRADIPVMGHVGLTPQSVHRMGGHRVQGREQGHAPGARERIIEDARAVEAAGAFAVVLEGIPSELAREITGMLGIPTIGIGAGPHCDGQVLVLHDLLGLLERSPRFAKRYLELRSAVTQAVGAYVHEVRTRSFPSEAQAVKGVASAGA